MSKADDAWIKSQASKGKRKRCGICARPKVSKRMKELIALLNEHKIQISVIELGRKIIKDLQTYNVHPKTFQRHYRFHKENCHGNE